MYIYIYIYIYLSISCYIIFYIHIEAFIAIEGKLIEVIWIADFAILEILSYSPIWGEARRSAQGARSARHLARF